MAQILKCKKGGFEVLAGQPFGGKMSELKILVRGVEFF